MFERMGRREREVVTLAAQGLTDKEISAKLGISRETVSTYWRRIFLRFDSASRTEVVAKVASSLDTGRVAAVEEETAELRRAMEDCRTAQARENAQRILLEAISVASLNLLSGEIDITGTFEALLTKVLEITKSEIGFVAEVVRTEDSVPFLRLIAAVSASGQTIETKFQVHDPDSLIGQLLRDGGSVMANDLAAKPVASGLPPEGPEASSFLGLPVRLGPDMIGALGLMNRAHGYDHEIRDFMRPIVTTVANLLKAKQIEERRLLAERESARVSAKLRTLLAHLPSGVLFEDADRQIRVVNQAFCNLFHVPVPPESLVGVDCAAAIAGAKGIFADPDGAVNRILEIITQGENVANERLVMADGRVLARDFAKVDTGNGTFGFLWHYRDITSEHGGFGMLEAVLRTSMDAVIVIDEEGSIVYWNDQASEVFGYSRTEAANRCMSELIIPEEYRESHRLGLLRYLEAGEAKVFGTLIKVDGLHRSGERIPLELLIAPVPVGTRRVFSATIRRQSA